MPTWDEAQTPQTSDEIRTDLLVACTTQGCTVNGWPETAPQRALVEGNASALAYGTELRAALAKTASPATVTEAGSSWVDAIISWFDLDDGAGGKGRIKATKAVWTIGLIVTSSAAPLVIDNTSTIQLQAEDGTIFECAQQTSVTLNLASSYKGTARFVARKVGTTGNQNPGQITKKISGPAGLSVDLTVTQVLVTAARDDETDAQVIARGLSRWGTISIAGWVGASFLFLVLEADPSITRIKVKDDNPNGPGTTEIIIATAAGTASDQQVTTVAAALATRSRKTLGNPPPTVKKATVLNVSIIGLIEGDGTNASLLANAIAAVTTLASTFPIGGLDSGGAVLPLELLHGVLIGGKYAQYGVPGFLGATGQLTLATPLADIVIGADDIIAFNTSGLGVS